MNSHMEAALLEQRETRELEWRREQAARDEADAEARMRLCGVSLSDPGWAALRKPERWRSMTAAEEFVVDAKANAPKSRFLLFCGDTRHGKTLASAWVLRALGARGYFVSAPDLPRTIDPWQNEKDRGWDLLGASVVVLDDLGQETLSSRFGEALFRLIDGRQSRGRTVISTNQSVASGAFEARYGRPILARIAESGRIVEVG